VFVGRLSRWRRSGTGAFRCVEAQVVAIGPCVETVTRGSGNLSARRARRRGNVRPCRRRLIGSAREGLSTDYGIWHAP
jgi:hypothetical protein